MFGPAHCCCTLLQVPMRVLPPVSNVPATEVEMVCPELWRAVVVVDRFSMENTLLSSRHCALIACDFE